MPKVKINDFLKKGEKIKYKKNNKIKSFTFVEILVSFLIMGMIAILTIPPLITKYQKKQTAVKLERAYSIFSNALNIAISVNGAMSTWNIGTTGNQQDAYYFAQKYIFPYVKLSKDCVLNTDGDCEYSYTTMNSNTPVETDDKYIRYILNDGTFITQNVVNPGGNRAGYIRTLIDINGRQKPNKMGKDVFEVGIFVKSTNPAIIGRFVDWGFGETRDQIIIPSGGGCNKNAEGWKCLSLIMLDGWKLSDDYPW